MLAFRLLLPALVVAIATPAAAQNEVPDALGSLKPHQVVEAVLAERQGLELTPQQAQRLDSLHLAIRSERHRYSPTPAPGKAHRNVRMRPMISQEQAYGAAMAVLTPDQRDRARTRFTADDYRLPAQLQQGQAATGDAEEPLRRHAAQPTPARRATEPADSAQDPLQHRGGEYPTAVDGAGAKASDPATHRQ